LYNNPEAHGHTFNMAPDECLTPRQIMEAGYTYFNSKGVEFLNLVGCAPEGGAVQEMCGGLRGPFRHGQGIQHGNQTQRIV
jgi:hypothetical protein